MTFADGDPNTPELKYTWSLAAYVWENDGRNNTFTEGIYGPSSRHQGGAHILMGDGAVKFITDSIEAGNSNRQMTSYHGSPATVAGEESPYGLWGSLGTRANKEVIETELNQ